MDRRHLVVLGVERARDLAGALERGAEPQEVEGAVVRHGLEADAAEQQGLLAQRLVEALAVAVVEPPAGAFGEPQPEPVERLPRLERERLADGAGVLARAARRAQDRHRVLLAPGEVVLDLLAVVARGGAVLLDEALLLAGGGEQRTPVLVRRQLDVEQRLEVDRDQPRGVVEALDVALQPEAGLGDAGDQLVTSAIAPAPAVVALPRAGPRRGTQHPGVLRSAALARVDDVRPFAQRDAREPAGKHPGRSIR